MLERSALGSFSPAALTAIEQGVKHPVGVVRTLKKVAFQSLKNVGGTLASQAEGLLASAAGQTGQFTITQVSLQGVTCFVLSFINHLQQIQRLQVLNQLGQPINPTNPTQPAEAPDEEGDRTCQVCRNRTAVVQQKFALVCQKASNPAQAQQGLNAICVAIAEEGRLKAIADRLVPLQKAKLDAFLDEITQTTTDTDALSQQLAQLTAELITTWDGVRYALKSRKSIEFLKWLKSLSEDENFKQHIFKGEVKGKKVTGCHFARAVDGLNVRYANGATNDAGFLKNSFDIYEADIEMKRTLKNPDLSPQLNADGSIKTEWVLKIVPNGLRHSFFSPRWVQAQVLEEVASSGSNKNKSLVPGFTRMWRSSSESGAVIRWFYDVVNSNRIASAFPEF